MRRIRRISDTVSDFTWQSDCAADPPRLLPSPSAKSQKRRCDAFRTSASVDGSTKCRGVAAFAPPRNSQIVRRRTICLRQMRRRRRIWCPIPPTAAPWALKSLACEGFAHHSSVEIIRMRMICSLGSQMRRRRRIWCPIPSATRPWALKCCACATFGPPR